MSHHCPSMFVLLWKKTWGCIKTPSLLQSEEVRRRYYKTWHTSKKKAFTKYQKRWADASKGSDGAPMAAEIERAKKYCQVIRAICHTQVGKAKIGQKKANIKEITCKKCSNHDFKTEEHNTLSNRHCCLHGNKKPT